jgi:hypothetical protein
LSPKLILEWVNHADLMRVKGVGSEYADLLEAAGVDTVPELAQRNAASLAEKLEASHQRGQEPRPQGANRGPGHDMDRRGEDAAQGGAVLADAWRFAVGPLARSLSPSSAATVERSGVR